MNKKTIIYARISKEDGIDNVSLSINNQINICKDYLVEHNLTYDDIYFDDGYSGTNFERPSFKRLIKDIIELKISTVVVKDFSRIGRNFIKTSFYIEDFFHKYNIRLIAVNDNYDSNISIDDLSLPLKNYLNAFVANICKKKRINYIDNTKHKKSFGVDGIYGYQIIDNKYIVDEVASGAVRLIFSMYLEGQKIKDIINKLISEKYTSPSYHKKYELKSKLYYQDEITNPYNWKKDAIYRILKSREYIGAAVNIKSTTNIKGFKRIRNKNPTIIENHHEAIISIDDFNKVQHKLKSNTYSKTKKAEQQLNNFLLDCYGYFYKYKISKNKYISYDLSNQLEANLIHKFLYEDTLNIFKFINNNYVKLNNLKFFNQVEYIEKDHLMINLKKLYEKLIFKNITKEEYNNKVLAIKARMIEVENKNIDEESFHLLVKEKIELIENLNNTKKLDFLKVFISKVIILKNEDSIVTLKIMYK